MKVRIDPMFIRCVKEEIAAGEVVTIAVRTGADVERYEQSFSEEELESVRFLISEDAANHGRPPASSPPRGPGTEGDAK